MAIKKPLFAARFCWICSRRLYAGGRAYKLIIGPDGHSHPCHADCVRDEEAEAWDQAYQESKKRQRRE